MSQPDQDPRPPWTEGQGGGSSSGAPTDPQGYRSQPDFAPPSGPQPSQQPYGQPSYQQPVGGQQPSGQPGWGQQPYQQVYGPGYGLPGYGPSPYGPMAYGSGPPALGPDGRPALDQPCYGIGFVDAVRRAFQKYARFDGRASRSEYWWFTLFTAVVFTVAWLLYAAAAARTDGAGSDGAVFAMIVMVLAFLALVVPSISISVRRLHDGGYSGLLYLINLVPYLGSLVLLVLMLTGSRPEGARYDRPSAGGFSPGSGPYGPYGR